MRHFIVVLVLILVACGGGGDSTPKPSPMANPMTEPDPPPMMKPTPKPNPTPSDYDFTTLGEESSRANADKAFATLRETGGILAKFSNEYRIDDPNQSVCAGCPPQKPPVGNPLTRPTTDTKANEAWDMGWTGKGVKIGVVDNFDPLPNRLAHGYATRAIVAQIAPEADIVSHGISLNLASTIAASITALDGRAETAYDALQASGHFIINSSFGVDPYRGEDAAPTEAQFNSYVTTKMAQSVFDKIMDPTHADYYNENMLFVNSAGNSGEKCTQGLHKCRLSAAALLRLRETEPNAGERVIYVGALADDHAPDTLASYSIRAGQLTHDYIVAHDDVWQANDAGGTSFAAPRVAGAAALVRHKFPNLNAPQLKQVLLQTAEDLGATGPDEIFGYGRLDVLSALSPIGKLMTDPPPKKPPPSNSGCGGGNGGEGNKPTAQQPPAGYDLTEGTPSNSADAICAFLDFYGEELDETIMASNLAQLKAIPPQDFFGRLHNNLMVATRDTNAAAAWQLGWTGKGVKVGHLDDFTTKDITFDPPYNGFITTQQGHGDLTRLVTFQVAPEIDHLAQQITFGCNVPAGQQDREIKDAYNKFAADGYNIVNNSFGVNRYDDAFCGGTPGLRSLETWEAWITEALADDIFRKIFNPSDADGSYNENMLFVFAAGNLGRAGQCTLGTDGCNLRAASTLQLRADGAENAGDRVMFVGALDGNSTMLAPYSQAAGKMQYDYLVAHASVLSFGDHGGTSFAAPRVAGAAALVRHRFPNLDGPQLKQVLLQTAEDLGAAGVDEVFGWGELDILSALSPVGNLMPKPPAEPETPPPAPTESYDFTTLGTASTRANADTAFATHRETGGILSQFSSNYGIAQPDETVITCNSSTPGPGDPCYTETTTPPQDPSALPIAATDTEADKAWDLGWTGKGVKVGIVDSFTTAKPNAIAHGYATRAIVAQIAPEADIMRKDISLYLEATVNASITILDGRAKTAYDALETSEHFIINSSFAVDPYRFDAATTETQFNGYVTTQLTTPIFSKIMTPAADSTSYNENMLFVHSAGNSGEICTTGLHKCRISAAALLELRKTVPDAGDRIIYVGSLADDDDLTDDTKSSTLAAYSIKAGELKNDYIVAHDDVWKEGDAGGTSFATPRVAGAAALVRHKFPNLNAPQLKQVLLQTADDIGATGTDEVFGYGRLNVLNALSPVGKLSVQ